MAHKKEMANLSEAELFEKLRHCGPFSWFRLFKNGVAHSVCLMCEKDLTGEDHVSAVWENPEFKRLYVYNLCLTCAEKYRPEDFEEKMMLLLPRVPRFKG